VMNMHVVWALISIRHGIALYYILYIYIHLLSTNSTYII
jgi:hypothetical protein